MKVINFPINRLDASDPKVAAGLTRLIDDLDLLDIVLGPVEASGDVDLPLAA